MMARRWLVAAVVLLALGGCGDEPEAEPATVPVPVTSSDAPAPSRPAVVASRSAPARAAAPAPVTPQAVEEGRGGTAGFVTAVQRDLPSLAVDRRDDELAALARQACAGLAAGRSAGAVVTEVGAAGVDRAGARRLIRLAIATVCPGQDRRADEF